MIYAKSTREIALMKKAGECVADVFETLRANLRNGITTLELDELVAVRVTMIIQVISVSLLTTL